VFFRSRIVLEVGFGGLLSIMPLAGIDALRVLGHFRRSDDQIRRRYLAENHILNDIRSDVYVSGTYVRDYLLEPEPPRADTYRANREEVRKHMEACWGFRSALPVAWDSPRDNFKNNGEESRSARAPETDSHPVG